MQANDYYNIDDIRDTIINIQNSSIKNNAAISVYISDGFKIPYSKYLFLNKNLSSFKNLDNWLTQVSLKNKELLFILYKAQLWNDMLINKVKPYIKNKFTINEINKFTFDITIMIGRYEFTPFGIHTDSHIENTIHFNIGKNNKFIYYWGKNPLEELFNPKKLMLNSYKTCIKFNDIFELDSKKHHIGSSPEGLTYDIVLTARNKI